MFSQDLNKWSASQVKEFGENLPDCVGLAGHSSGLDNAMNIDIGEENSLKELEEKKKKTVQKIEEMGFDIKKVTITSDYVGAMDPKAVLKVYFEKP